MTKCNTCTHKRTCIDGANYIYAAKCQRYREERAYGNKRPYDHVTPESLP